MNNLVNANVNGLVNELVNAQEKQVRMGLTMHSSSGIDVPVEVTIDFDLRLVRLKALGDAPADVKREVRRVLRAAIIGTLWN